MTLFAYRRGITPLHRANAGLKILGLIALCIITFAGGMYETLDSVMTAPLLIRTALCLAVTIALFIASGCNRTSFKPVKFVLIIGAIMTVLRLFNQPVQDALAAGLLYTVRFLITAVAAQIVFETTSPLEIKEAMGSSTPALAIALAINFIPQVFATWERVHTAARARTTNKKGLLRSIHNVYCEIQAFFSCLIYQAETKRKALLNRSGSQI
jgi:biotin transport system permease protein